jgi:hypothetical protein
MPSEGNFFLPDERDVHLMGQHCPICPVEVKILLIFGPGNLIVTTI